MNKKNKFSVLCNGVSVLIVAIMTWTSGYSAYAKDPSTSPTSTSFALEFAKQCADAKANMLVSPFGVYTLLSLLSNGANGQTQNEILKILGSNPAHLTQLNAVNKSNCQGLFADDKNLKLSVANAIFVDKDFPLLEAFTKVASDSYLAKAETINFSDPRGLTAINGWVNDKTHGCIQKILDKLMAGDCAVLLNAVYFKGTWLKTFEQLTRQEPFHLDSGSDKTVSMMHEREHVNYWSGGDFSAIDLPYFENKQGLIVLLPAKGKSAIDLLKSLDEKTWDKMVSEMKSEEVNLSLPKLHVEMQIGLKPILNKLGMNLAFNPRLADFKSLSAQSAYVSRVIQKTFIDVDEKGTEAAAVTAMVMAATGMAMPHQPVEFRVDRPYILALVDHQTGQILFVGLINEP